MHGPFGMGCCRNLWSHAMQEYKPAKLKIGCSHPDPVVESNSLMSVDPPELPYQESHHLEVCSIRLLFFSAPSMCLNCSGAHCWF